jgi:uncharacterized protein (UPF0333 family)
MLLKNKRGQATLELFLLVAAVIAGLLIFLGPSGLFRSKYTNSIDQVSNGITTMSNRIAGSYGNGT